MVLRSTLLATLLLSTSSLSLSTSVPQTRSVIHERRNLEHKSPWSKRERIPTTELMEMRIGLAQRNTHHGHDMLMEVSDPLSPRYGHHWLPEEVLEAFAPSNETVQAAISWVTSTLGIDEERLSIGADKGWLSFQPSVGEAEALFETEYWLYEHESQGRMATGVDHYSVPEDLAQHIDFVFPGVVLGELRTGPGQKRPQPAGKSRRQNNSNATCAELVTPACITDLYGLPVADKADANNQLGIFELSSWYQHEDLDLFFGNYAPEIPQGTRPRNLSSK